MLINIRIQQQKHISILVIQTVDLLLLCRKVFFSGLGAPLYFEIPHGIICDLTLDTGFLPVFLKLDQ